MTRIVVTSLISFLLLALITCGNARAQTNTSSSQGFEHPLDPLTSEEIRQTVDILQTDLRFGPETRFAIIDLDEPDKAQVREDLETGVFHRAARALFYNWESSTASDAVVDLTSRTIVSWKDLDSSQPPIRRLVISRLNEVVKRDDRWKEALSKLGITDDSRINILARMPEDTALQQHEGDFDVNGKPYMMDERPGSGGLPISIHVNLTKGEIITLEIEEGRTWTASDRTPPNWGREPRTAMEINQPDGTSFEIQGSKVQWRNWTFHYGVHPRRGLELFNISYRDHGEERSILYRAAVSETLTPYGDPEWGEWYPLDEGDYGFGIYGIRSAVLNGDGPPNAVFRDAILHDHEGNPYSIARAVTFYEKDGGVLWRHAEESARARDFVVAYVSAIDNYDYVFKWIFHEDGAMDVEVELSGIINSGSTGLSIEPKPLQSLRRRYRTLVAPGVTGPNHQHFFAYRLDFDIDGSSANSILETNVDRDPIGVENPDGHWFAIEERVLMTELTARRSVNSILNRSWRIVNRDRFNDLGENTAYALIPKGNAFPAAAPGAPSRKKMGFVDHHLWVTPFEPDEMYAGGTYLEPGVRGGGLPAWTERDRSVDNTDLVVWYVLGLTHQVRPEDYPLMPVHTAGFSIWPFGFFSTNPSMDVASEENE